MVAFYFYKQTAPHGATGLFYFSWVFFKKLNCYENRIRLDKGGTGNLVLQLKNSGFAGKSMGFAAM
jgi:hypothetical protein